MPELFRQRLAPDVVLLHTSRPAGGAVSLGVEVNVLPAAIEAVRARGGIVVTQANTAMPSTHGDAVVPLEAVDYLLEVDEPLATHAVAEPDVVSASIGARVAALVPPRATLQLGIGAIPDATLDALLDRRDLRIWSETGRGRVGCSGPSARQRSTMPRARWPSSDDAHARLLVRSAAFSVRTWQVGDDFAGADGDRFPDQLLGFRGRPEHLDHVDVFGNVCEAGVRVLAEHPVGVRVDRDDVPALFLQHLRDPVGGFLRVAGRSHHCDRVGACEYSSWCTHRTQLLAVNMISDTSNLTLPSRGVQGRTP